MIAVSKLLHALSPDVATALADDNDDGIAEAGVIEEALSRGEAVVRGALASAGYDGDAELPADMEDLAITLAVERLLLRRRELLPGPWKDRADRARLILDEVAAGRRTADSLGHRPRTAAMPGECAGRVRRATLRRL